MASRIISRPREGHRCAPGWTSRPMPQHALGVTWPPGTMKAIPPDSSKHPPGVVVQCDCGQTWVVRPRLLGAPGMVLFRPEGAFERWRRERRERKAQR